MPIPGYILYQALAAMRNRGMDGVVGMAKTLCFPDHPDEYAYRIMAKGTLQIDVEKQLAESNGRQQGKISPRMICGMKPEAMFSPSESI